MTFAIEPEADYRAVDVALTDGCDFMAVTPDGTFAARVPLPGRFNVSNALAAWAAARALGAPADGLAASLAAAATAPGRFQPVDAGQPFGVVVDYAHKPDALEQVLLAARELASGRLIVRLRRGRGPRPRQAAADGRDRRAAGRRRADHLRQPALGGARGDHRRDRRGDSGVAARRGRARRRPAGGDLPRDRAGAPGDVVVIAGKGHEQGQEFEDGRKEPFDDAAVAREAIAGVPS